MITKNLNEILPPSTTAYKVKVKALGDGQTYRDSEWSSEVDVTISQYATPTNVVASSGQPTTSISWDAVPGATAYRVYYSSTQEGTYTYATIVFDCTFYPSTSYLSSSGYIKITAYGGRFTESEKSSVVAYNIQLEAPINVTASSSHTGYPSSIITWDKAEKATSYQLYYSSSQSGSYTQFANVYTNKVNLSNYKSTVSSEGYIKIKASADNFVTSEYSDAVYYNLVLSSPTNFSTNGTVISWDAVPGADGYNIYDMDGDLLDTISYPQQDISVYELWMSTETLQVKVSAYSSQYIESTLAVSSSITFTAPVIEIDEDYVITFTSRDPLAQQQYVSCGGSEVVTTDLTVDVSSTIVPIISTSTTLSTLQVRCVHGNLYGCPVEYDIYPSEWLKIEALSSSQVTTTTGHYYSKLIVNGIGEDVSGVIGLDTGEAVYISAASYEHTRAHSNRVPLSISGSVRVSGKLISLCGSTTYTGRAEFWELFKNCTGITDASQISFPNYVTDIYTAEYPHGAFEEMFRGCTSLTTVPSTLPATTLAERCYLSIFRGCTSLTTAPTLPATTLATWCYQAMFYGCTSLTTAPTLPATTIVSFAYAYMFQNCTSLTTPPSLVVTGNLGDACYSMFRGCTALNRLPYIQASSFDLDYMFYGCTSLNVYNTYSSDHPYTWTLPSASGSSVRYMLTNTGGDNIGTPTLGTTYYTNNEPV